MRRPFAYPLALLAAAQIALLASLCHAFNDKDPFDISADFLEYQEADQHLVAEGHVVVVQGSSTLTADKLDYFRQQNVMTGRGNVVIRENGDFLMGDQVDYNLKEHHGTVVGGRGYQGAWRLQGQSWEKREKYLIGRNTSFTSCDLVDPHYHVRATRVHLVPDQYFWAWNNIGYVDTTPLFYSPFMYKSLGKRKIVVQFQPGHDDVSGNFVKTTTTMRFTDNVYNKVYYDHFSDVGNGLGDEFDYSNPGQNRIKGSLFGYYINPHNNAALAGAPNAPQYNIQSYHWQQLNQTDQLQSNINLRKNVSFNNQYFPQNSYQAVNDITSSVAFTHREGHWNHRVIAERFDSPDAANAGQPFAETHMQTASLPRYEFTMYQIPLWVSSPTVLGSTPTIVAPRTRQIGPIMVSANGNASEVYTRTDDAIHTIASSQLTFSDSIPINRYFSLTPSLTPQLGWQDTGAPLPVGTLVSGGSTSTLRGLIPKIGTSDTLRWKASSSLTFDNTYSYIERFQNNSLVRDVNAADKGVETHHVSFVAFLRPSRSVLVRSFSGYDLRQLDNEDPNGYNQRKWDPWTTEITYDTITGNEVFFRYQMGYYPIRDLSWEGDYRFRGPYRTMLDTGLLYNKAQPDLVTWNNTIGIYISPGWRVNATLHSFVPAAGARSLDGVTMNDSEFIVIRDMHCWSAQFVYRNRLPYSREYSIMFDLKLGPIKPSQEAENRDVESQFYPWRSNDYAR